jgi:hypothetical protein
MKMMVITYVDKSDENALITQGLQLIKNGLQFLKEAFGEP